MYEYNPEVKNDDVIFFFFISLEKNFNFIKTNYLIFIEIRHLRYLFIITA